MHESQRKAVGRPQPSTPCSLREACARAGLDREGARCPECPIHELCRSELRWLIRTARPQLH